MVCPDCGREPDVTAGPCECSIERLEWVSRVRLAIFVLCIYMIRGSFVYGDETVARGT